MKRRGYVPTVLFSGAEEGNAEGTRKRERDIRNFAVRPGVSLRSPENSPIRDDRSLFTEPSVKVRNDVSLFRTSACPRLRDRARGIYASAKQRMRRRTGRGRSANIICIYRDEGRTRAEIGNRRLLLIYIVP